MSFLNQLKSQASALQDQQRAEVKNFEASTALTESACQKAWYYLSELAKQLNVIEPPAPRLSLDGTTHWPAMKLNNFRADFRKKRLRDKDVHDYLALGWDIVPQSGRPVPSAVSANFPPDLQRIEARLSAANLKHERKEVRHPEKNTLLAIRFEYLTEARGSVKVTADHEAAQLIFRIAGASGFEVVQTTRPAAHIQTALLDELAKMIVAQPHTFA